MQGQAIDGLVQRYDMHWPDYPDAVFYAILKFWGGGEAPVIVDIGCGTGISTRAFHQVLGGHCTAIGIDSCDDRLAVARASTDQPIAYLPGRAEALPAEVMRADIITAGQSLQYFDRRAFYGECRRVLAADGVLAVFENKRDWRLSPLLQAHEAFLEEFGADPETGERYSRHDPGIAHAAELSLHFDEVLENTVRWSRPMSRRQFYRAACTDSRFQQAQRNIGEAATERMFYAYVDLFTDRKGMISIDFMTKLYLCRGGLSRVT